MSIPPGDLYQLARVRYEDRLSEAEQRRSRTKARSQLRKGGLKGLTNLAVTIGMALMPLRESLRSPISEPRSLDVST